MKFVELRDWIYPTMEPSTHEEDRHTEERENAQLATVEAYPNQKAISEAYIELYRNEMDRLKSVEARLSGVLSLTPITASLLVGGTFALVNGGLSDSSLLIRLFAAAALLYLNLQVVCSTIAAIRGLSRATWVAPSIEDIVPASVVDPRELDLRIAKQNCKRQQRAERNINYKVTQMAIAHTAIRNFAVGSALIAILGFAAVGLRRPGAAAAKTISNDTEIQRLLRCPQVLPEPAGSKGEPGQPARSKQSYATEPHKNP